MTHTFECDCHQKCRYLQVRQHAQQAPQQAAIYCFSVSLPLDQQENPNDGFTLDLHVTDDVKPEELQTHVPAEQNQWLNPELNTQLLLN